MQEPHSDFVINENPVKESFTSYDVFFHTWPWHTPDEDPGHVHGLVQPQWPL